MTAIVQLPLTYWDQTCSSEQQQQAIQALERGSVLVFPYLTFQLQSTEGQLLSPDIAGNTSRNITLDSTGKLHNSEVGEKVQQLLQSAMVRYAMATQTLLERLFPGYLPGLRMGCTSFRPVEIEGRESSWRQDDTRLHVDSFPAFPMQGSRILRVFSNINPHGRARRWRLGESFEQVARHHLPKLPPPWPGAHTLLKLLGATKRLRTDYDHFMLRLHDRMKSDVYYQQDVSQMTYEFPPGSTWMVFTDQVSHAGIRGQYAIEQTCHLPLENMQDPGQSPLRVLERLVGRELV